MMFVFVIFAWLQQHLFTTTHSNMVPPAQLLPAVAMAWYAPAIACAELSVEGRTDIQDQCVGLQVVPAATWSLELVLAACRYKSGSKTQLTVAWLQMDQSSAMPEPRRGSPVSLLVWLPSTHVVGLAQDQPVQCSGEERPALAPGKLMEADCS